MNQEEAERALRAWASIERDELVRAARKAGLSKNRIHTITGIARTTIDRILDLPMPEAMTHSLHDYLTGLIASWPRNIYPHPHVLGPPPVASALTVEQLVEMLLADAAFRALKLGTFLNTPDGQVLAPAVSMLTPPPYQQDATLLLKALQLAAQKQHEQARTAVVGGAILFAGGVLAVAVANSKG